MIRALRPLLEIFTLLVTSLTAASASAGEISLSQLQIGPSWNRAPVSAALIATLPVALQRVAYSTAAVHDGTGVYLGKFAGKHLMATNTHVLLEGSKACYEAKADFVLQGRHFACDHILTFLTDVELAVFSLKTRASDEAFFASLTPVGLETHAQVAAGTPLATFGFGGFMNDAGNMLFTSGSYCKTFSSNLQPRYMNDPDSENTLYYKVWSVAVGCNASWGDSGSPVVNVSSGKLIGLLWTAKYPKSPNAQKPAYLDSLFASGNVWNELTYASDFIKLHDVASARLAKIPAQSEEASLLNWLLQK